MNLKEQTAKGLLWGGLGNGAVQVVSALMGIVLLRLLTPADYGKIAVLVVFSNIAGNLQESGFIQALCNKKEPEHSDFNAVFWFNILVAALVYLVLFFSAPLIAQFYGEPILVPLSRYLFLCIIFTSFGTIQRAWMYRSVMVKQTTTITLTAVIVSNLVGITMAFLGYAFWGLATQTLVYTLTITVLSWTVSPWRPTWHIDLRPAFRMFGFSCKLLITSIFYHLNNQVFAVLLGRYYNTHVAGYYSNARKWDDMCINTLHEMVRGVAQPVLSQIVDEKERYRNAFRKMLRFVCFVSFPAMLGMGLIAKEFILITVGEKWIGSAMILSMLSVYGAFYPLTTLFSNMTISLGRSGINMFCNIAICVIVWIGLITLHSYGLYTMIYFFVAVNILWLFVWQWFAWRLIGLRLWDVLKDVVPFLLLAVGVMVATYFITLPIGNIYLLLPAKVVCAAALYISLTWLSGAKIMRESVSYLRGRRDIS